MNYGRNSIKKKREEFSDSGRPFQRRLSMIVFRLILIVIAVGVFAVILRGVILMRHLIAEGPDVSQVEKPEYISTRILDTRGKTIEKFGIDKNKAKWVSLDQIPDDLKQAFVDYLDEDFYRHHGIEANNTIRTWIRGVMTGNYSSPAETITERLVINNVYQGWNMKGSQTGFEHHLQEQYLAAQLEKQHSKQWILEQYLNTINLGEGTIGVASASERYFAKPVSQLNVSEAAVLAAIVRGPDSRNPIEHGSVNASYRKKVLKSMYEHHDLTASEYRTALADPVYHRIAVTSTDNEVETDVDKSAYCRTLRDFVIHDLQSKLGYSEEEAMNIFYRGGLTIYSTQDTSIWEQALHSVQNQKFYKKQSWRYPLYNLSIREKDGTIHNYTERSMRRYFRKHHMDDSGRYASEKEAHAAEQRYKKAMLKKGGRVIGEHIVCTIEPQVSVTVMSQTTGEVKAMIGKRALSRNGKSVFEVNRNRAVDLYRQPGNLMKLFSVYAPALDSGSYTLSSTPMVKGTGLSGNISGKTSNLKNADTLENAIRRQKTDVAAKVMKDITPESSNNALMEYHFSQEQSAQESGTAHKGSISNLELTAAFTAMADGGVYTTPVYYQKVMAHNGRVILNRSVRERNVMKDSTAYLLTRTLQLSAKDWLGKKALGNIPVAGQFSRTPSGTDAWFAGYSPYYTCTVWGGNDDESKITNTEFVPDIWEDIMGGIHKNLNKTDFKKPKNVVVRTICTSSGKLAIDGVCPDTRKQAYVSGTEPTARCDLHETAIICRKSGLLASENCPKKDLEKKVFLKDSSGHTTIPKKTCTMHHSDKK